ncbi:BTAD domain-containing putative transcriptional regulator, partial [Nocardioides sp.]|uniref:AfsR/SARP family transcriptional regulator n=1 Tax=Nocardioides sp. TaxID=35761 RepID=UPI003563E01D
MIRVLGPVEVLDGTDVLDIGSPRHREVLAALVVETGRVVSTEALLERVWGDGARGATPANLHAVISRLRGRLREVVGVEISTVSPGYRLDAPEAVDAEQFQRWYAQARAMHSDGTLEAAREVITRALDLWRGEAYAGVNCHFAEVEAARLEGLRLGAIELAAEIDLETGRTERVLEQLPAVVAAHPLRESLRGRLMLALFRAGRQAEALEQFAAARELLAEDLGLDPGPELQALHQRILEQDADLLVPIRGVTAGARQGHSRATTTAEGHPVWSSEIAVPPTAILGRDRDIEYLTQLLIESTARLLTVTGVGGVGKTRLAHAVAEAARGRFRDGVSVVSLASLADAATVLPAIGRAVGLALVEGPDPGAAVIEHLRGRELLVVLDNAEHLLEAAPAISRLVASCPTLTLLITSRTPLRIRGELQYPLAPLDLPDPEEVDPDALGSTAAVALFVDRARSVAPGFVLDDGNAPAVGALCRRLAGIPLAIELAAARVGLLTPAAILGRLDQLSDSGGARDLPPRQRTMRAAIGWSYDLLEEDERRLFRALACFADGFTLEAAESVTGAERTLELLGALVEHSLVVPETDHAQTPRFRLLEPVQQYAAGLLVGDEELRLRTAHLRYYLDLAESLEPSYRGPGTAQALEMTRREHPNMVAAIEWGSRARQPGPAGERLEDLAGRLAWAIWLFWWMRGHLLEGRRLSAALLERDLSDEVRVRVIALHSAMAFAQGDLEASALWEQGADLALATGDQLGYAHNLAGVGLVCLVQEDLSGAESVFVRTVEVCERAGLRDTWLWTLAHVWLATARLLAGRLSEVGPLLDRALAAARARQDPLAIYISLYTSTQLALAEQDLVRARSELEEGIRLSLETGDLANLAYFLDTLGVVEAADGRPRRTAVLHGASTVLRETVGSNIYGYYKPDEAVLAQTL